MIDAISVHAPNQTQVVCACSDFGEKIADLDSRIAPGLELSDGRQKRVLRDFATSQNVAKTIGQSLACQLFKFWFRIKQINMTWPTMHKKPYDSFDSRREVRSFG